MYTSSIQRTLGKGKVDIPAYSSNMRIADEVEIFLLGVTKGLLSANTFPQEGQR